MYTKIFGTSNMSLVKRSIYYTLSLSRRVLYRRFYCTLYMQTDLFNLLEDHFNLSIQFIDIIEQCKVLIFNYK